MRTLVALFLTPLMLFCPQNRQRACFFNDEAKRVYACGRTDGQYIALTFDDGPHGEYTAQILDILAVYQIKATFFVIGENAERYPHLIERMKNEGHAVGNHTYSHNRVSKESGEALFCDVEKTDLLLKKFGINDRLFRPPGGECDQKVLSAAQNFDFDVILWTVDPCDWRCPPTKQIVDGVVSKVKSGDIVLMHDYVWGESHTPEALEEMIPLLLKEGYSFKRVDELIRS